MSGTASGPSALEVSLDLYWPRVLPAARALSASLIEDRGTGRAFELHITDTGRDALEAVWPHYADAHTWKATDVQALDPRFIEVTHRDSADISHDPRGVMSTGTTWTGLPVRFWLPRESYWGLRDAFNANGILWIEVPQHLLPAVHASDATHQSAGRDDHVRGLPSRPAMEHDRVVLGVIAYEVRRGGNERGREGAGEEAAA